nr:YkvA family protein [Sphingomicrobium lutaoense]
MRHGVLIAWLAARDPRTPLFAKLIAGLTAAYALSPIDLIPDFIPIFGLLDDLLLVPAGIWLALLLIPDELVADLRAKAEQQARAPASMVGLAIIVTIWAGAAFAAWRLLA